MSSGPTLPEPADRASQRDEDAQYYRQVLHKFIAMGTDLAEAVHRQALAEPAAAPQSAPHSQPEDEPAAPNPSPKQAITFDRLARTVRRTIALARKLSEPGREAPGPKLRLKECPPEECRTDCAETDALHVEPCERPEEPDLDADEDLGDDLDEQSLADLIASIRHDSGLATLSDAQLWKSRRTQGAQEGVPGERCGLCAHREAIPRLTREPPRSGCKAARPPRAGSPPGTGPPEP
jgi:hypothetical protein